jgi:hypothetical protein
MLRKGNEGNGRKFNSVEDYVIKEEQVRRFAVGSDS